MGHAQKNSKPTNLPPNLIVLKMPFSASSHANISGSNRSGLGGEMLHVLLLRYCQQVKQQPLTASLAMEVVDPLSTRSASPRPASGRSEWLSVTGESQSVQDSVVNVESADSAFFTLLLNIESMQSTMSEVVRYLLPFPWL